VVGKPQSVRSTSSAKKRLGANQLIPSGTVAQAAIKVRMYECNLILPALMNCHADPANRRHGLRRG
jgi:hypothetical protein